MIAKTAEDGGEFHGPSISEFFPDVLFTIAGIPVTRIHLIQFLATAAIVSCAWYTAYRLSRCFLRSPARPLPLPPGADELLAVGATAGTGVADATVDLGNSLRSASPHKLEAIK